MPFYFIVCLEVFRLDVRMLWKSFSTQGSHNNIVVISKIPKTLFHFKGHNTMSLEQYNQLMSNILN